MGDVEEKKWNGIILLAQNIIKIGEANKYCNETKTNLIFEKAQYS